MDSENRAKALTVLFNTLEGHIERGTREESLKLARIIRGLCFDFLDYIELPHQKGLVVDRVVAADIAHALIAKVGRRLLEDGVVDRRGLAVKIRERWAQENLPEPVRSLKTIRRALEEGGI